jgi:hypothetical protein
LRERSDVSLRHGIVFVAPNEQADAPDPLTLLRRCHHRPSHCRAAESSDEFAPSKTKPHLALLWPRRLGTSAHARLPRTGSRLRGEGLRP